MSDKDWKYWAHVTKLDPDKKITEKDCEIIATSGTDALMLSGTLNVTKENMLQLFKQVKYYGLPIVIEPAGPEGVIFEGIDHLFIPSVLNSNDVRWIVGKHKEWLLQESVEWDKIIPEAYIVLNSDSSVAKVTKSTCDLTPAEVASYAEVADRYFKFPIVYIEYSGTFGSPAHVKAASESITNSILYYGGGIDSSEKAEIMAKYADTIVVGNAVYEKGAEVLKATVKAVL